MKSDIPPDVTGAEQPSPNVIGTSLKLEGGKPYRRYLLWYGLAAIAVFATWGVMSILIPNQVQTIEFALWFVGPDATVNLPELNNLRASVAAGTVVPTGEETRLLGILDQFDAARARNYSMVISVAMFLTMLVNPIAGVLSDRTRSRLGRRAPWIVASVLVVALALTGLRYAGVIILMVLFWTLASAAIYGIQAPLTATVADRVPQSKVGFASAISGIGTVVGGVIGSVAAGLLMGVLGLNTYFVIVVALAAFCLLFIVRVPDQPSIDLEVTPFSLVGFFKSLLIPLRDSDYRWVWIAKVIMMFGYATQTTFSVYMLQSYITPALSLDDATRIAPLLTLAGLPGMLITIILSGRWSDRIKRRKPFVVWASVVFGASMIVPLVWPTLGGMLVQAILGSAAFGAFIVVDQALFIDVIVDKRNAGRDLGMSTMGGSLGQAAGPLIAAQVVAFTGGYEGVWILGSVVVFLAALAILPVRRVR